MRLHDRTIWRGRVAVTVRDLSGHVREHEEFSNVITNGALDAMRDALRGSTPTNLQLDFMGVGADSTTAAATDVALGDERVRNQITSFSTTTTGEVESTVLIQPGQANGFTIEELGWFGGAATSTLDSGLLIARVNYTRAKNADETIQVTRTDTFA